MKKAYYLFNPGRMSRKDNTLIFQPEADDADAKPRYLPVEGISGLYIFGSIDANSALFNFLGQHSIPVHFFDYHQHYTGSFSPREYLLSGQMLLAQTDAFRKRKKRLLIATRIVDAATFNIVKNLRYYHNRGKDFQSTIDHIESLRAGITECTSIDMLMGIEGNCRQLYYQTFSTIMPGYDWDGRKKRPPVGELNALISFGNSMCYTLALDAIYNSQLNPTISYLHEPGVRRFSLALDMAEIFKPILVDRLIFRLCNKKEIRIEHFDIQESACFLSTSGRKVYIQAWEERLKKSLEHRKLNRSVSYRHLVRLECYKLAKYLMKIDEDYEPFKIWW